MLRNSHRLSVRLSTARRLGFANICRALAYRCATALGIHPVQWAKGTLPRGAFFEGSDAASVNAPTGFAWGDRAKLFGNMIVPLQTPVPDFLADPLTGHVAYTVNKPWWKTVPPVGKDVADERSDIKRVWELSRFSWAPNLAQQARNGDAGSLVRLNTWLNAWCDQNPAYFGPNWVCGQEASIRILNLAQAALILDEIRMPQPVLIEMLRVHLRRIRPTLGYAIAQDNNHGTSEAAALFVGGTVLSLAGDCHGKTWEALGRKWLENRAARLVMPDGGFSMYSVNYHRVFVDTMCLVEAIRRKLDKPEFSEKLMSRMASATDWLRHMVDAESGDAPNIGTNDGTRLLSLDNTPYRDYRPSVELAANLFQNRRAYLFDGSHQDSAKWLELSMPERAAPNVSSALFDDSGFAILNNKQAKLVMRYPRFLFRPSQADALHVDLSVDGINLLRDDGTFSYAAGSAERTYFGSVKAHNSIEFDDTAQMPKIGQFLYGEWLVADRVEQIYEDANEICFAAGYVSAVGHNHFRLVRLGPRSLVVIDQVSGLKHKAILRWRLAPGPWKLKKNRATNGRFTLEVSATVPIRRIELVSGLESRTYLETSPLPILEVEVQSSTVFTSKYRWDE